MREGVTSIAMKADSGQDSDCIHEGVFHFVETVASLNGLKTGAIADRLDVGHRQYNRLKSRETALTTDRVQAFALRTGLSPLLFALPNVAQLSRWQTSEVIAEADQLTDAVEKLVTLPREARRMLILQICAHHDAHNTMRSPGYRSPFETF